MNAQNLQIPTDSVHELRDVGGQLRASIATLQSSFASGEGADRRLRQVLALLWSAVDALDELSVR